MKQSELLDADIEYTFTIQITPTKLREIADRLEKTVKDFFKTRKAFSPDLALSVQHVTEIKNGFKEGRNKVVFKYAPINPEGNYNAIRNTNAVGTKNKSKNKSKNLHK